MRPFIENVFNEDRFNWQVREYHCKVAKKEFTCPWHYHAEYELVLYRDPENIFNGTYIAGDGIGSIRHNTLLLYGPGLPHMLSGQLSDPGCKPHYSLIFWFSHKWLKTLQQAAPELKGLSPLLRRSAHGLQFSPETGETIFELLSGINEKAPHHQFQGVIQALNKLADDTDATELSATPYIFNPQQEDTETIKRVEAIRKFIEDHYHAPIRIDDLCREVHMSESSAYRMFEKHFNESFSEHLKRFRIGKACELLANTHNPVSLVAERSGFNNLSNFNRQFKTLKKMTPTEFRGRFK